jgi:hypothetical protein
MQGDAVGLVPTGAGVEVGAADTGAVDEDDGDDGTGPAHLADVLVI